MDFDKAVFAANLKKARDAANVTQSKLSELCGIPQSALSTYESAKSDKVPRLDDAIQMAKELGVSLDWLCGLSESSQTITPIQWLLYTDKLLNDPPGFEIVPIPAPGPPDPKPTFWRSLISMGNDKMNGADQIQFTGTQMREFFKAYNAVREVRATLGDELYSSVVIPIFEKYRHLFTPGAEVDNNGQQ